MRFHVYYEADSEHLLISDSQTHSEKNKTCLNSGVVNVLSLPGGKIRRLRLSPPQGKYKSASLFIGGNDCFVKGGTLSEQSPQQIAEDLKTLADTIVPRTGLVHVIGIPERHNKKERTAKVNEILERFSTKADWKYRSVSKYIWSRHISEDSVHLTDEGLKNLKNFWKRRFCTSCTILNRTRKDLGKSPFAETPSSQIVSADTSTPRVR